MRTKWRIRRAANIWLIYRPGQNGPWALANTWREAMAAVEFETGNPVVYGVSPWRITLTRGWYHES